MCDYTGSTHHWYCQSIFFLGCISTHNLTCFNHSSVKEKWSWPWCSFQL
jgi:hypothetical protein